MARLLSSFVAGCKFLLRGNVVRAVRHLLVHHEDEIIIRGLFGEGSPHGCNFVFQHINSLANVIAHRTGSEREENES